MQQVFIGRQPIFDRHNRVFAYELLWRAGNQSSARFADGDQATTDVLLNALMDIGLDRLVGNHPAFINLTRGFVLGEHPLPDMQGRVVLEILEDIEMDDALLVAICKLASQGYTIALDDFIYTPSLQPLVELADIIKIDLLSLSDDTLEAHVRELRRFPVKLLAEKVEDRESWQHCLDLGFDYFQGYFFARPNVVQSRRMPGNRLAIIQLVGQLTNPEVSDSELESLISQDVSLSFRLLRYINSARFGLQQPIDSLAQAIMLLGRDTLRQLTSLLALSQLDSNPRELMMTALIRARMAEQLARRLKLSDSNRHFTAGLFSVIDAMLGQPMEQVLAQLPLSEALNNALLNHEGELGELLGCVIAWDEANWAEARYPALDTEQLCEAYLQAIDWAGETSTLLV